jgi:sodium transport system permease protein
MRGALLVVKKEFLELGKDRKTMFFTFLLPMLLYPALFTMINRLGSRDAANRAGKPSRVCLADPSQALAPVLAADSQHFQLVSRPGGDLKQAIRDQKLEMSLELPADASRRLAAHETFPITAMVDTSDDSSKLALERLKDALKKQDARWVEDRLRTLGASPELASPTRLETADASDMALAAGKMLGAFLPYILMIMMYVGAMQHGIYATAGEKERGTLLSLLATSLPRHEIILGKLIYVFSIGLITAIINLGSMAFSMVSFMSSSASQASAPPAAQSSLAALGSPVTLGLTFLLIVPLGLFFANFIILGGIHARNTVEAGTSLMPGTVVVCILGVFSLAPGLEKMALLPYVPVINVSLAIRKLFSQQGNAWEYTVAFLMTVGLAALMTWLSTRMLNRESALFKV